MIIEKQYNYNLQEVNFGEREGKKTVVGDVSCKMVGSHYI